MRLANELHCQQVSWTCPSLFKVPPSFFIGRFQTVVQSRNKERSVSGHRDKQGDRNRNTWDLKVGSNINYFCLLGNVSHLIIGVRDMPRFEPDQQLQQRPKY